MHKLNRLGWSGEGWSIFGIHVDFLRAVKGGLFLMKRPLGIALSVYTNSENAIAGQGRGPAWKLMS
jgi:hypothetical protein